MHSPPAQCDFYLSAEGFYSIDSYSLKKDSWYHIAITFDKDNRELIFFINGQLVEKLNKIQLEPLKLSNLVAAESFNGSIFRNKDMVKKDHIQVYYKICL